MRFLVAFVVTVIISGCVTVVPPTPRMAFPEKEYDALAKVGNATVKGQAFLKTRGGDVKTAAGEEVLLNPVTSYTLEWYEKSYLSGQPIAPADPKLSAYIIKQTADGNGRFVFKNVPPGNYFVTTVVTWEAPTGYQGSLVRQGGVVTKRIAVKDGDELDVMVTR